MWTQSFFFFKTLSCHGDRILPKVSLKGKIHSCLTFYLDSNAVQKFHPQCIPQGICTCLYNFNNRGSLVSITQKKKNLTKSSNNQNPLHNQVYIWLAIWMPKYSMTKYLFQDTSNRPLNIINFPLSLHRLDKVISRWIFTDYHKTLTLHNKLKQPLDCLSDEDSVKIYLHQMSWIELEVQMLSFAHRTFILRHV